MTRRFAFLAGLTALAALLATGCGLFDSDNGDELYSGQVTVGITDNVPASGTFNIVNVYPPSVREITAVVQVENAKDGMEVEGRWYQLGTIQQKAKNLTPEGLLISQASFKLSSDSVNKDTKLGGGRLRFIPNAALPVDSYLLKVYVDGKLAKTVGFVVLATQQTAPAPAQPPAPAPTTTGPAGSPTAVPTATPIR